jgi:agmatine/peptidylarginine deiminase
MVLGGGITVGGVGAFVGPGKVLLHLVRNPQQDDDAALAAPSEIVTGREVVGVPCPVIVYGGGIHCITRQGARA